jgi:hypothetical protein
MEENRSDIIKIELSKEDIIAYYEAKEKQLKANNKDLQEENHLCHKLINDLEIELQS